MKTKRTAFAFAAILGTLTTAFCVQPAAAQFPPTPPLPPTPPINQPAAQQAATYVVTNMMTSPIKLYWDNGIGEILYTTIAPGQTYQQPTYVGHSWVIRLASTGEELSRETVSGLAQGRVIAPKRTALDPTGLFTTQTSDGQTHSLNVLKTAAGLSVTVGPGIVLEYTAVPGQLNTYVGSKATVLGRDMTPADFSSDRIVVNDANSLTMVGSQGASLTFSRNNANNGGNGGNGGSGGNGGLLLPPPPRITQ